MEGFSDTPVFALVRRHPRNLCPPGVPECISRYQNVPAQPLTDALIRTLKAPLKGRYQVSDARSRGLSLRVSALGEKSWGFRYHDASGRLQRLTLGTYPALGLADARVRADEERRKVVAGASPAADKRDRR